MSFRPRRSVVLLGVSALHLAVASTLSLGRSLIMDDAYISFRYGWHLAHGHGVVFNPGERVEGYTNFLWVLLSAATEAIGVPSPMVMPLVGLLSGLALVLVTAQLARSTEPDAPWYSGLLAAGLVAFLPAVTFYAGTGLETVFFTWLVTMAMGAVVRGRAVAFVGLTTLAFLTRPEAALLGLVGTAWLLAQAEGKAARVALGLRLVGGFALLAGPYLAWKWLYFGDLVPATLRAKAPEHALAARYVLATLAPAGVLAVMTLWTIQARGMGRSARPYALFWVCGAASVFFVGPDWMPAGRLLAPYFPALAIAFDRVAVEQTVTRTGARLWHCIVIAGAIIQLVSSGWITFDLARRFEYRIDMDEALAALVHRLEVNKHVRSIGTVNVGLVGYVAPNVHMLDLGGLTDAHIAHLPGTHLHKKPSAEYLESKHADAYLLTSSYPIEQSGRATYKPDMAVEAHVFALPWFQAHYAYAGSLQLASNYHYHVFLRR